MQDMKNWYSEIRIYLGNGCDRCENSFGYGYDDFVYPYTVSFCSEGRYEVIIKGKKAIARKVE